MSINFEDTIIEVFEVLKYENFKINYPDHRIFICGGEVNIGSVIPSSFRHRLINKLASSHPKIEKEIVLAETFKDYFKEHAYNDLLIFEDDIAKLASIVVIFLESPGSLVELGMFCTKPNFYKRLLIVAPREQTESEDSFIYLGPLNHIRRKEPSSIAIYPWPTNKSIEYPDIHLQDLCDTLLDKRNNLPKNPSFSKDNSGHVALLVQEIIRLSYPILLTEIELAIESLGLNIPQSQITRSLYLLNKLNYLKAYEYSGYKYYYPLDRKHPRVKFGVDDKSAPFDENKFIMKLKMSYVTDDKNGASRKRIAAGAEIQKILTEQVK
ncbi:hypothetical protein H5181_08790 [Shewanella sp. SG44-2]|uniref:retron St85 family effector protein n=1 Tax=Shewanella TaxID=22 RepID=UPI00160039DC|nr:retron St85 family effector protein [Shewanella sp. SG44-2]MBB1426559.1 hypothetical protein [Shewanella sp. SG44-2]